MSYSSPIIYYSGRNFENSSQLYRLILIMCHKTINSITLWSLFFFFSKIIFICIDRGRRKHFFIFTQQTALELDSNEPYLKAKFNLWCLLLCCSVKQNLYQSSIYLIQLTSHVWLPLPRNFLFYLINEIL